MVPITPREVASNLDVRMASGGRPTKRASTFPVDSSGADAVGFLALDQREWKYGEWLAALCFLLRHRVPNTLRDFPQQNVESEFDVQLSLHQQGCHHLFFTETIRSSP